MAPHAPHLRHFVLALAVVVAGGLVACGGDDGPDVEVSAPGTGSGGSGDSGGEPSGTGSEGSGSEGGLGRCGEILRAYGTLAATALQGEDAAANAQETLEDLADDFPDALQDDLSVVADAFGAIAEQGVVDGASELTTSEFREANENILGYLRDDCLPG
jgi:hypothetical protein